MNLMDLVLDDELLSFLPAGSDSERAELASNIVSDGRFTDALVVWMNHGIVVDGQTRFSIWQTELNRSEDICPEIIEKHFASKAAVKAWMIRRQSGRRNWTTSQRAMMAAELATLQHGEHGQNKESGIPLSLSADQLSVSVDSVKLARSVKANGSHELQAAVVNGEVTVSDAANIVDLPKREQTKAVRAVKSGKAKTVSRAAKKSPNRKPQVSAPQREPGDETENEMESAPPKASEVGGHIPACLHAVAASVAEFSSAVLAVGKLKSKIKAITESPGGIKLSKQWTDIERCLEQVHVYLKAYRFWAPCPECKICNANQKRDPDCKVCRSHGWIAKTNGLSDRHKQWLTQMGFET